MKALVAGIVALVAYATVVALIAAAKFPGALAVSDLLFWNLGSLCPHLFIGGIGFFASCLFHETKYSIAVGAGIPALMFILKMLANTGETAEKAKYFTFFTLFHPDGITAGETSAIKCLQQSTAVPLVCTWSDRRGKARHGFPAFPRYRLHPSGVTAFCCP
ncbi:MAG: hypothetical protein LBJ11_03835 [Oscillospiraceae bacterium]|jgi:ABC-2 type transport system permease protein|nr:hypothetical protein [Oscillospiraceae bacterium]